MSEQTFSLSELNDSIKNLVEETFDFPLWVMAEIADMKVAANGHCYLELLEKNEKSGKDVARARATIWRNTFPLLKAYFEETTGQTLNAGLKVMVLVEVRFHSLYGYSLNVVDINPGFTLGEMALMREKILRELENDGILEINKQIDFPQLPKRIAVISSEGSAGYEDFLNELMGNAWHYHFNVKLFPAVMQGEQTEAAVVTALEQIFESVNDFDVVVIIRGGGAKLDLSAFDNKLIAEHVAQFPLPVLVGIGHTKDQTVLDIVAYQSLKTPTAVADFLLQKFKEQDELLDEFQASLQADVNDIVRQQKESLQVLNLSLKNVIGYSIQQEKNQLSQFQINIHRQCGYLLEMENQQLSYLPEKVQLLIHGVFHQEERLFKHYFNRIEQGTLMVIRQQKRQMDNLSDKIKLLQPETLLKRGYHLVTDNNGKIIKGIEKIAVNDIVQIHFNEGIALSKILEKKKKKLKE